jgi:hypothetical protein
MSAAGRALISRLEARRSARPHPSLQADPEELPHPRRQIVGSNRERWASRSLVGRKSGSQRTRCWRGMDSNYQFRSARRAPAVRCWAQAAMRRCATGLGKITYLRRFSTSTPSRDRASISASEKPRPRSTASPCSLKRGGALRVPPGVRESFIGVPRAR